MNERQRILLTLVTALLIVLLIWLAPTAIDAFNDLLARGISSLANPMG